jgi:hypothetical protein
MDYGYAGLSQGRTFGLGPLVLMACHRSQFTCSVSQIWAFQTVSAWSSKAVSALTARRTARRARITINESGQGTGGEAGIRTLRCRLSNLVMARDFWF